MTAWILATFAVAVIVTLTIAYGLRRVIALVIDRPVHRRRVAVPRAVARIATAPGPDD